MSSWLHALRFGVFSINDGTRVFPVFRSHSQHSHHFICFASDTSQSLSMYSTVHQFASGITTVFYKMLRFVNFVHVEIDNSLAKSIYVCSSLFGGCCCMSLAVLFFFFCSTNEHILASMFHKNDDAKYPIGPLLVWSREVVPLVYLIQTQVVFVLLLITTPPKHQTNKQTKKKPPNTSRRVFPIEWYCGNSSPVAACLDPYYQRANVCFVVVFDNGVCVSY